MTGFLSDFRHALRSLRRSPATVALVVLTLGLGIAATTVIFSAVEGVLINPLRLEDADRYVTIYRGAKQHDAMVTPTHELAELWAPAESFELMEPTKWERPMVTGLGPAETVGGMKISGTFHRLLGMAPVLGRTFTADETSPGGPDVVLLSHGYWRRMFGGRRSVLGETIDLDGRPHEIVGVLPPGFMPPATMITDISVWLPYRGAERYGGPMITARLKEGVTREQAEAELTTLMAGHPLARSWKPAVVGVEAFIGSGTRSGLQLLMTAVALLMLIATLNVANVLLGRAHARTRETAVRAALGAGRVRIARQLLVESLLLGLVAGAAGIVLAGWGLEALRAFRPDTLELLDRVTLNATVLAFAAGISLATSVLFGLAPAIHAASATALASLRSGQRLDGGGAGARRFRLGLVVAEVALSVILLVGAGLLTRSLANLYRGDPGFRAEGLVRVDLELPRWKYEGVEAREALAATIRAALEAVPGAGGVAGSGGAPPRSGIYFGALEVEGREGPEEASTILHGNDAGPGYFEVLGQPVLDGRGFTEEETRTGANVFVVGRSTAAKYWAPGDAVGSRIRLSEDQPWSTVVGVVEDVAVTGLGDRDKLQVYTPARPANVTTWLIRSERATGAVVAAARDAVHGVDLDLGVTSLPVTEDLRASVGRQRFIMILLISFAAVAMALAAVGFYGVLSHLVAQRRREIGIRMSLGADRRNVLGMVIRQGSAACALGLLAGLPAAFAGTRVVASQLHGIGRGDVVTYVLAALLLLGTSALASWLPARRAAGVDPMVAIREE